MPPAIALISPNENAWSETFVQAQRELLPAEVHYLYGAYLPRFKPDGHHFISNSYFREGLAYAKDRLLQRELHSTLRNRIRAYLRKHQIQAVLAQYGPTGVEMAGICKDLGIPLIVHFHGFDAHDADLLKEYGGRYREKFDHAAAVIAVSQLMVTQLREFGCPPEKLHYNPCGADLRKFTPADLAGKEKRLLAAGRFADTKAPHLTLMAFAQAREKVPELKLTMAGQGPLLAACRSLVRGLNQEDAVQFAGVLDHAGIVKAMSEHGIFVQHSITAPNGDSEGTPVAIMEAGAAGLPVISTRHAGIPDVVLHEKTGLLVDECDVEAMAAAMIRLATNSELAQQYGAAARTRIEAEFGLRDRVARLWSIIESTLS